MSLTGVAGIRAQRTEVEALLAYTHTRDAEAKARAWWRLQQARRMRLAGMEPAQAAKLPALPAPPPGALSRLQVLALRAGLLDLASARPSGRLAREIA